MKTSVNIPYSELYPEKFEPADYVNEHTYRHTRAPVEASLTIIPEAFKDERFYEIEQERVLRNSWIAVGCTSQVSKPGQSLVINLAGQSVIITRNKEGELRAFYNVCRHRGAKMIDDGCSVLKSNRIRCPYHSWAYDLNGECIGTPMFDGSEIPEEYQAVFEMGGVEQFDKANYGLFPVNVASWGFLIMVNLGDDPQPLDEVLGDLPERFANYRLDEWEVQREVQFEINANYKLIGENFMEYYHLPWVHPELIKVSRVQDHYRWQGAGMYMGMTTWPVQQGDQNSFDGLLPMEGLTEQEMESARFIWLFPNIALTVMSNHAFLLMTRPQSVDFTIENTYLLCHPDSLKTDNADEHLDRLIEFWRMVNIQDIDIVERVQEGLRMKPYRGGRMCYHFEEQLHRYQNMIIDKMVGRNHVPEGDTAEHIPMFVTTKNRAEHGFEKGNDHSFDGRKKQPV